LALDFWLYLCLALSRGDVEDPVAERERPLALRSTAAFGSSRLSNGRGSYRLCEKRGLCPSSMQLHSL
jgi:hypothetical protein